ncbi:hypothetical protein LCGC14_1984430 [marine sediment metagenome]|uniref:Uncharacterized protein n=1 Tax=marine sediment metagenome TaxID=412755 RepID=A0A0F9FW25_9ZZZZ
MEIDDQKKYGRYTELLKYESIKNYLSSAIGKKKRTIDNVKTYNEQLKSIHLSTYLMGTYLYFEFCKTKVPQAKLSNGDFYIKNPDHMVEILRSGIHHYESFLKRDLDEYIVWVKSRKNDNGKLVSQSTIIKYFYNVRGYIHSIKSDIKFRNFSKVNRMFEIYEENNIDYEKLIKISKQLIFCIKNPYMNMFIAFLRSTGLSCREICELNLKTLRSLIYYKDKVYQWPNFNGKRIKTNVRYSNFISKNLYDNHLIYHLRRTINLPDESKIFDIYNPDIKKVYIGFQQMFNRGYTTTINYYFPEHVKYENTIKTRGNKHKLFTMHSYRSLFISACNTLNINIIHRSLFVGHKPPGIESYNLKNKEKLLEDFKLIQELQA